MVWLIHDAHAARTNIAPPGGVPEISEQDLQQWFGPTARVKDDRSGIVVDPAGQTLGRILQTSPESDHIVGFSGPTNVLIGVEPQGQIVGVSLIESGDTHEHVQQVVNDPRFLEAFAGLDTNQTDRIAVIDGVSGATLTSLAIIESILNRLGGGLGSLKFPDPPTIATLRPLFPDLATLSAATGTTSTWILLDDEGQTIGTALRTSPAADNIVGYQGPTDAFIGFDNERRIVGIVVGASYDNEPYTDYVRDDKWFRNAFNGRSLEEVSELDLATAGIEGVSGATMTSMAVADGIVAAAARTSTERAAARENAPSRGLTISARNWGTIAVLAAGLVIGLTSLRGRRWVRLPFQCVLIGYLGFINGDLVSQALLVGWARHGVPWESMLGMFLLTAAALIVPITTRRNVYCHQLCPHGAAQQWLRPSTRRRVRLPRWLHRLLSLIPGGLLLLVVAVGMGAVSVSLVDIEPFDAYLIGIAGAATLTIAVVGLVASAFVPMAYCRYGCPTGALLEFVRRHARSDRLTTRDAVAIGCLVLALLLRS